MKLMKKSIVIVLTLIFGLNTTAQKIKFKVHSAEIGFGGFYMKKYILEGGGISFIADLTTSLNKNLISSSLLTGAEIGVVGSSTYNFNEYRIQYGRELYLQKWLKFELFGGLGYYNQKSKISEIMNGSSISIPFKLNIKFYFNENFGIGLNNNYSANKINNNFSINLVLHYKFD